MFKKTVEYIDFNGDPQIETFWFHTTRDRLTDNLINLKDQIDSVDHLIKGEKRELTIPEVVKVLDLIKAMVKLSYGARSEDGKRFRQSEEVWEDFRYSAAYDKLLTDFMEKPEDGMDFIHAVMPQDLIEKAQLMVDENAPVVTKPDLKIVTDTPTTTVANPLEGLTPNQIAALMRQAGMEPTTKK